MAVVGQHPGQALSIGLRNLAGCLFNTLACMGKVGRTHCLASCEEQNCHLLPAAWRLSHPSGCLQLSKAGRAAHLMPCATW